ncbi:MAG: hypothetical protein K1X92_06880 [Bacteroidia bacterium]|nr:hypothetical protein [Bacteroidia bacterium]
MRLVIFIYSAYLLLPFHLYAQKPDFYEDSLFVVSGKENLRNKWDAHASVKLFSDGDYLTLTVDVKDDIIENKPDNLETDHIEVWFALPSSAFPRDFEYNFHPKYIYSATPSNPYEKTQKPRFFSVYSEYASSLGLQSFLSRYDYPSAKDVKGKSMGVPYPENLKECRLDYGIVQFGLYPDKRNPVQLNKDNYRILESMWGNRVGDFTEGVKYVVDKTQYGYIISAQFSVKALGFVQLPKMEELRVMVDIIDKDGQGKASTILSTSQYRAKGSPVTFNTVRLKRPLRTNSTEVPDAVYNKLDFHPVYTYLDSGWLSTSVETDMVEYGEQNLSKSLLEIKFSKQPIRYTAYEDVSKNNIKKLSVDSDGVNTNAKTTEYYIINGQVFESEVSKIGKSRREALYNHTFSFPDGSAGLILKNKTAQNPYGWGNCKNCYEEVISIIRLQKGSAKTILAIYQGNTGNPYCQIGDKNYKGFYVYSLDWLREGKMLVFRLSSWDNTEKKRVKITWEDDGSKIAQTETP